MWSYIYCVSVAYIKTMINSLQPKLAWKEQPITLLDMTQIPPWSGKCVATEFFSI